MHVYIFITLYTVPQPDILLIEMGIFVHPMTTS